MKTRKIREKNDLQTQEKMDDFYMKNIVLK